MRSRYSAKIGILFLKLVAKLPFPLIYFLSDIFYLLVYYIVGYRKKVVVQNLKNSFPEKNEKEIKTISKKFFHHFCDLTLETIKTREMDESDFRKRMKFKNLEVANQYFEKGKNMVVLTMHYNNWEWNNCFPFYLQHKILAVYKPLHNINFNKYINENRGKFGAEMTPDTSVLRRVIKAERSNERIITWLIGDQTPPRFHKFWLRFLNQEALFFEGPAYIARKFNHPIFFHKIEKNGRGKYESSIELLFDNPKEASEAEIMNKYIQKMEEVINENPEFYLWSHRRWKHKRPEDIPMSV